MRHRIVVVVSNKSDAGILERAQREGLKGVHVPCKKGTERAVYDRELTRVLRDEGGVLGRHVCRTKLPPKNF